jgi:hypothetical protein
LVDVKGKIAEAEALALGGALEASAAQVDADEAVFVVSESRFPLSEGRGAVCVDHSLADGQRHAGDALHDVRPAWWECGPSPRLIVGRFEDAVGSADANGYEVFGAIEDALVHIVVVLDRTSWVSVFAFVRAMLVVVVVVGPY